MIAFLMYALTASIVLFGYLLLNLMFHPIAAAITSPVKGAIVLCVAALLNFWKRRVAAGVALLGAILIWPACWSLFHSGQALLLGWVFIILPALAVVSLPLVLTTVYTLLVVAAVHKELELPRWLFPEDRK